MDGNTCQRGHHGQNVPSRGGGLVSFESIHSSVDFTGINEPNLGRVWKHVIPLLEPALDEGDTIEHVLTKLFKREAQLWIGATKTEIVAACVTEILHKGGRTYCNIWLVGGRGINDWVNYLDRIEEWAHAQGCDGMIVERGRTGWQRILPDYKVKAVYLKKEF